MIFLAQTPSPSPTSEAAASPISGTESILWFSVGLLIVVLLVGLFYILRMLFKPPVPTTIENRTLTFASMFLLGLFLVFMQSMAIYYFADGTAAAGKDIFDACKTILPPIISLVIGYYFGKTEKEDLEKIQHQNISDNPDSDPSDQGSGLNDAAPEGQP